MAPKPFPFPISVGVDICRVNRVAAILQMENVCNRWARKTFTRLEWPTLCRRFQRANQPEGQSIKEAMQDDLTIDGNSADHVWMLPKLSKYSSVFDDSILYWSTIADGRSKLTVLAHHLAGRWAAKEAVIKAYRHRRLFMPEISILRPSRQGSIIALVDPVCDIVRMDERVAKLRGLRGFNPRSQSLDKEAFAAQDGDDEAKRPLEKRSRHFNRRRKIEESDRQLAEISISHDDGYAVAVCMASDSPDVHPQDGRVVDDGTGPPMHEPQWGDEGWLDTDGVVNDGMTG